MSLENFYYVSQIIAAVAIFPSLIFVGLQLRQADKNQQASKSSVHLGWTSR